MAYKYSVRDVKDKMNESRWGDYLRRVNGGFDGPVHTLGRSKKYDCPICSAGGGFRLTNKKNTGGDIGAWCDSCGSYTDALAIAMKIKGQSLNDVLHDVIHYLGQDLPMLEVKKRDYSKTIIAMRRLWSSASTTPSPEALKYYNFRGLKPLTSPSVKYIDSRVNRYGAVILDDGKPLKLASIVLAMTDGSGIGTLIRIFLNADGSRADQRIFNLAEAQGLKPKSVQSKPFDYTCKDDIEGCGIRLGKAEGTVYVCEGYETGLAVAEIADSSSVIACSSAHYLASVELPERVNQLVICADKDKSGAGAAGANALAEKYKHLDVVIKYPSIAIGEKKGVDFADELMSLGTDKSSGEFLSNRYKVE